MSQDHGASGEAKHTDARVQRSRATRQGSERLSVPRGLGWPGGAAPARGAWGVGELWSRGTRSARRPRAGARGQTCAGVHTHVQRHVRGVTPTQGEQGAGRRACDQPRRVAPAVGRDPAVSSSCAAAWCTRGVQRCKERKEPRARATGAGGQLGCACARRAARLQPVSVDTGLRA